MDVSLSYRIDWMNIMKFWGLQAEFAYKYLIFYRILFTVKSLKKIADRIKLRWSVCVKYDIIKTQECWDLGCTAIEVYTANEKKEKMTERYYFPTLWQKTVTNTSLNHCSLYYIDLCHWLYMTPERLWLKNGRNFSWRFFLPFISMGIQLILLPLERVCYINVVRCFEGI